MVLSGWVCLVSEGLFGCDVGGVLFLLFFFFAISRVHRFDAS